MTLLHLDYLKHQKSWSKVHFCKKRWAILGREQMATTSLRQSGMTAYIGMLLFPINPFETKYFFAQN